MKCGFYSANVLKPGARGQQFHIDHPYPLADSKNGKLSFMSYNKPINLQSLLYLTEANSKNGATSFVPYSQLLEIDPSKIKIEVDEQRKKIFFKKNKKKYYLKFKDFISKPNTLILFNGLAWHRGGFNYSYNSTRIALNGQWIPNYVTPMHKFSINKNFNKKVLKFVEGDEFPLNV